MEGPFGGVGERVVVAGDLDGDGAAEFLVAGTAGVLTYGIGSVIGDEGALAHGNDERVSVEGVGHFVRFLHHVVTEVAGS